jgi:hypothetical protein
MQIAVMIVASALAAPIAGAAITTSPAPRRTVPCDERIGTTKFPYLGNSQPRYQYRLVLGAASVPPAYLEQVVATQDKPWAYWRKAGLVVRANGEPVTVSVPKVWRTRAAITWGNGGHGVFSSVRIAGCGSSPNSGNAYAGGFYLRSRSACLPLVFRVGVRTATVRFGIGQKCD